MRIRARTVAPAADARYRLPWATVTDDGLIDAEVRDREFTQRCLEIANAVDELEGRPVLRYDETSTEVDIAAPADEVFESLTVREVFERWFGLPLAIELFPGGAGRSRAAVRSERSSRWSRTVASCCPRTPVSARGNCPKRTPGHGWRSA